VTCKAGVWAFHLRIDEVGQAGASSAQHRSAPLVENLHAWMRQQRGKLSGGNDVAKAIDYMLKRWPAFAGFLDDGRVCLSNNAAERALRGIGCSPGPIAAVSARR
jgi:hypothetical protein